MFFVFYAFMFLGFNVRTVARGRLSLHWTQEYDQEGARPIAYTKIN